MLESNFLSETLNKYEVEINRGLASDCHTIIKQVCNYHEAYKIKAFPGFYPE